jgi:hypothetical protein
MINVFRDKLEDMKILTEHYLTSKVEFHPGLKFKV